MQPYTCPNCGGGIVAGQRACAACGQALDPVSLQRLAAWRAHPAPPPAPPPPVIYQQTVIVAAPKSPGLAVLLTVLFGPLGMLYTTVGGALIMLLISVPLALVTGGLSLCLTWPICVLWGLWAAYS